MICVVFSIEQQMLLALTLIFLNVLPVPMNKSICYTGVVLFVKPVRRLAVE